MQSRDAESDVMSSVLVYNDERICKSKGKMEIEIVKWKSWMWRKGITKWWVWKPCWILWKDYLGLIPLFSLEVRMNYEPFTAASFSIW